MKKILIIVLPIVFILLLAGGVFFFGDKIGLTGSGKLDSSDGSSSDTASTASPDNESSDSSETFSVTPSETSSVTSKEPEKIRVVCVGDSITQGVGASSQNAYPGQLKSLLGDNYLVGNCGRAGAYLFYTSERDEGLLYEKTTEYNTSNNYKADIVLLMLGTNDTGKVTDAATAEYFKQQYKTLVEHYINLESKPRVYLITCLSLELFSASSESNLKNYIIPAQKAVAAELGLTVIDAYTDLYGYFITDRAGYSNDNLHPNANGYKAMAEYIKPKIAN